ncbi:MAG: calcineurin-like phosphoesterase family protein [Armatimonadetes bacterium]|nr:calcineurin-like phosphoesterase family protein [Armatimonadota bacterium]
MPMLALAGLLALNPGVQTPMAQGVVYEDRNQNGVRDFNERGIGGVLVSDQMEIVRTDSQGRWSMPLRGDDITFFVIKPSGWMTPVTEHQLPKFYYHHKPNGSPDDNYRFKGVEPTGPLPKSIDFPLYRSREGNAFTALFFGDPQPRDQREVDYVRKDIVEPLVGKHNAVFGVTLGDIAFDNLDTFVPLNKSISMLGVPWYNVIGNHDMNYESKDDKHSDETYELIYGPNYYSWNWGKVHFITLDDVWWSRDAEDRGRYTGKLGEEQLAWVKKDLDNVPTNNLVVISMHVPLVDVEDRQALYDLIKDRPFAMSVSAHTHTQRHHFIGEEDGFHGKEPHHHVVNVTTSGSWWSGAPDEQGIPHTTMRDGAPNGYSLFHFDGNQYNIEFRAARRHASYQMDIIAPDRLKEGQIRGTTVYANVFAGSDRSKVEIKFGNEGTWIPMTKTLEKDPTYTETYERDKELKTPWRTLSAPENSTHLWKSTIPVREADAGVLVIHVRTTDMFGRTSFATKGIVIDR